MPSAILVVGFCRPTHLRNTLESLKIQDALDRTSVWLDGHHGRSKLSPLVAECREIARSYAPADVNSHYGHHGINRLMLDALQHLSGSADSIIVLEDDCFPTRSAIAQFEASLLGIRGRADIFSVYGHPFLVDGEDLPFPRFQGWGWAVWTAMLQPVLAEARMRFNMSEREFLEWAKLQLTPEVQLRLGVTPGRNPARVIQTLFSWDACFALITAINGLFHMRTKRRVIFNCGMGTYSGHFGSDERFLRPPFNIVPVEEVWHHFKDE